MSQSSCVFPHPPPPSPTPQITDVLRVHEYPYIRRIQEVCASLPDDTTIANLDSDTAISRYPAVEFDIWWQPIQIPGFFVGGAVPSPLGPLLWLGPSPATLCMPR